VVVVISAPAEVRRARARVAAEEREGRLLAEEEKAARADFSYVNDGTRQQLDDFVAETMRALEAGRRE
jgi:dephospho-CoA kinase